MYASYPKAGKLSALVHATRVTVVFPVWWHHGSRVLPRAMPEFVACTRVTHDVRKCEQERSMDRSLVGSAKRSNWNKDIQQHHTVHSQYIAVGVVQAMVPRYKWERDISGVCHEPKAGPFTNLKPCCFAEIVVLPAILFSPKISCNS